MDLLADWGAVGAELRDLDPRVLPVVADAELTVPIRYPRKVIRAGANYFALEPDPISHRAPPGTRQPNLPDNVENHDLQ